MKTTKISVDKLSGVIEARGKAANAAAAADSAVKDARVLELEYKVQLQQLFLENGLDPKCNVDITTGVVTWPEEDEEVTAEFVTGQ